MLLLQRRSYHGLRVWFLGYIDGEKEDGQELDSGDYDDDVDDEDAAIADMEWAHPT